MRAGANVDNKIKTIHDNINNLQNLKNLLATANYNNYINSVNDIYPNTPLYGAVASNNLDAVKVLIEAGANVDQADDIRESIRSGEFFDTPLQTAVENGNLEIVKELIKAGADINLLNPLYDAARIGNKSIVSILLENDANVNHITIGGLTPLNQAASGQYLDIVRMLINKGAVINLEGAQNPLASAALGGSNQIVKELIEADANIDDDNPLYIAAEKNHLEVVRILIENNANVNQVSSGESDNETPLFVAAENGHFDIVKELIEGSADITITNSEGISPLFVASENGFVNIENILQDAN